ncbi:unnamed protein product [Closterium sp. Naga37s-1]|nr:unnamed protein product [Closterium sp. Naga37s-1]
MAVLRVFLLVLSVLIAAAHVVSATAPIFESDPARDVGVLAADDLSSPVAVKDASILPLMQEIRRMLKGKAVKVKIGPSEMKAIAEVGKELAKYSKKEWDRMVKDKKKQAEKLEKGWEDTKKAANEVKQGFEKVGEGARKAADDVKQGFEKATNFFGNLGRNRAGGTLAVMQRAVAAHCWRAATCSALIGRPRPRPSTLAQLVQTLSERQAAQRLSHLRALISHASALPVDLRPEIKVSSEPAAVVMENADQTLRRAVARLASRLKADTAATTPPATQSPPPTAPPTASLLTAPSPARTATPLAVAKTVAPSGKAAATARGGIGTAGAASELKASGLKGSRSAKQKLAAGGEGKAVRVAAAAGTAAGTAACSVGTTVPSTGMTASSTAKVASSAAKVASSAEKACCLEGKGGEGQRRKGRGDSQDKRSGDRVRAIESAMPGTRTAGQGKMSPRPHESATAGQGKMSPRPHESATAGQGKMSPRPHESATAGQGKMSPRPHESATAGKGKMSPRPHESATAGQGKMSPRPHESATAAAAEGVTVGSAWQHGRASESESLGREGAAGGAEGGSRGGGVVEGGAGRGRRSVRSTAGRHPGFDGFLLLPRIR